MIDAESTHASGAFAHRRRRVAAARLLLLLLATAGANLLHPDTSIFFVGPLPPSARQCLQPYRFYWRLKVNVEGRDLLCFNID